MVHIIITEQHISGRNKTRTQVYIMAQTGLVYNVNTQQS